MAKGVFSNPKERAKKISTALKTGKYFYCEICGSPFWRKQYAIKNGDCRFCSRECYAKLQRGRPRSDDFKKKCRDARRKKAHLYTRDKQNRFWRNSLEYKEWRKRVFERDNYTCQECKKRGVYLEAHHIKPFSLFIELRFEVSNGVTLCKPCHSTKPKGRQLKQSTILTA